MKTDETTSRPGVLFVDDEEKARKYFEMAFKSQYRVFTAESGSQGLEILGDEHNGIGVVVSDQRMPGMAGVDFLSQVRAIYPDKIRILTTAYSDLDSAIRSVNEGRIYQYVTKPWDLQDFRMVLKRAFDYYTILSERDHLMALKMSTLQRIVVADRLKTLATLAQAGCVREPELLTGTLLALIRNLPRELDLNPASGGAAMLQQGLARFMRQERQACATLLGTWEASEFDLDASVTALEQAAQTSSDEVPVELSPERSGETVHIRYACSENGAHPAPSLVFGVLCEAAPSAPALALFRLLAAVIRSDQTLELGPKDRPEEVSLSFSAGPAPEEGELEELLAETYDRWDTEGLGR